MVMVDVLGHSSLQVGWPDLSGLRVDSCLALTYIHQMNSLGDFCHDYNTINIVPGVIIMPPPP